MSLHNEAPFEDEICEHLAANGWLYAEKDAADYDFQLALFPADVLAWVQATQPDAWEVLTKNHGDSAGQTLLNRLRDSLDQSGTLHVLRQGFDVLGMRSKVKMAQFKPALAMNPDITQRYTANRHLATIDKDVTSRPRYTSTAISTSGTPALPDKPVSVPPGPLHPSVESPPGWPRADRSGTRRAIPRVRRVHRILHRPHREVPFCPWKLAASMSL